MKLRTWKQSDGSLTYFIDYRHDGQRRRKRLEGIHDRKAAEVAFADFRGRFARGQANLPTHEGLTIAAALDALIASKRATCTAGYTATLRAWAKWAGEFFGKDTPVASLTEKRVNEFRQARRLKADRADTINRKTVFLRAAAAKAVRDGKIGKNPLAGLVALSDPGREVWRWLREEEAAALLDVLHDGTEAEIKRPNCRDYRTRLGKSLPLWRLCILLLNTGARPGQEPSLVAAVHLALEYGRAAWGSPGVAVGRR